MAERFSRRGVLTGIAFTAANLLFSRQMIAADVAAAAQGVPAVGNGHLLTVVAVSKKTLRLQVIQQGKQGTASETGIVPRTWPEPLPQDGNGFVPWGDCKVRLGERPWQIAVVDSADRAGETVCPGSER